MELAHRQVGVERRHRGADAVDHGGRRDAGGAHRDLVQEPGFLGHGLVELMARRRDPIGIDRLDVGDDADDLSPFEGLATRLGDAPAESALAREEIAGHRLVDDEDLRRSQGVARVEGAPAQQAGADGLEVVGTDAVDEGDGLMAGLGGLATGHHVLAGLGQTEEGHRVGDAGRDDAGQRFETLQRTALEVRDLPGRPGRCVAGRTMVPVTRWSDSQPERRLFNSWSPRTKRAAPASRTMARANWPTMRTLAEASMAAIAGGAARAALERAVQIEPEGEERGGDAEGEGREESRRRTPSRARASRT